MKRFAAQLQKRNAEQRSRRIARERRSTRCSYCGTYMRPAERAPWAGYEETMLCSSCDSEVNNKGEDA